MSYQKAFNQYPVLTATKVLPASWSSADEVTPVDSRCFQVNTVSTNKSSLGPVDQISYSIPPHSFSDIESGTLALRGSLTILGASGATGAFIGPHGLNSLFDRMEVYVNGTMVENLQNYHLEMQKRWTYAMTDENRRIASFLDLSQGFTFDPFPAGGSVTTNFCIPLRLSEIFNNSRDFPLWLCSSIQITLYTRATADVLSAVTSYTINNPTLIYNRIELDPSLVNQLRQSVISGNPFILNLIQYDQVNQSAIKAPFIQFNKSLRSCLAIQATNLNAGLMIGTTLESLQLKVDGVQINTSHLSNDREMMYNIVKTYNKLYDKVSSFGPSSITAANFLTNHYLISFDLQNCNELGYTNQGVALNQIEFIPSFSTAPSGQLYVSIYYNSRLIFNPDGTVLVNYSM